MPVNLIGVRLDLNRSAVTVFCVFYAGVPAEESLTWYSCCERPYSRVTFSVRLRRKPIYYVINLLFPSIMFSVLTLFSLTLPPGCSERIGLGLYQSMSIAKPISFLIEKRNKSRAIASKALDAAPNHKSYAINSRPLFRPKFGNVRMLRVRTRSLVSL